MLSRVDSIDGALSCCPFQALRYKPFFSIAFKGAFVTLSFRVWAAGEVSLLMLKKK
jgi:hypothetical protein